MEQVLVRTGMAVPVVAVTALCCVAAARDYARRVQRGAELDGATLCKAVYSGLQPAGWKAVDMRCVWWAAGGLFLAGLPFLIAPSSLAAARWAACLVLLLLSLIDIRCGVLPDALTLPLLWAGLLLAWAGLGVNLSDAVSAAALAYLALRSVSIFFEVSRGHPGVGGGDIKLFAALGAWTGWHALAAMLLAACLSGLVYVLWSLAARRRQRRPAHFLQHSFAFGPHLAGAGAAVLVAHPDVQYFFI